MHSSLLLLYRHCGLPKALLQRRQLPTLRDAGRVKQVTSFPEFCTRVAPVVRHLGPHLSRDPQLLIKINRLAKTFMHKVGLPFPRGMHATDALSPLCFASGGRQLPVRLGLLQSIVACRQCTWCG
jgi:hypothetical protein